MLYLQNVVTLELDRDKCTGCKMCLNVCPHEVFQFKDKKALIAHKERCMECGACAMNCPENAIFVNSGVGCATAVINGMIRKTGPTCGCSDNAACC